MKRPNVLPHEETITMWWRSANCADTFDRWWAVSLKCDGACSALMDHRNAIRAIDDYAAAGALAMQRALMAPLTPPPATALPLEVAA